mgnify:CR=1 FL=1
MAGRLTGETALITGGGRGFGRAIALGLAAEGANVAVCARTKKQVKAVAKEVQALGVRALPIEGDVTKRKDVEHIVEATETTLGPVSIMINNAGVPGPFGPISEVDPDVWWDAQKIHVLAPFRFMHAVLPGMQERGHGAIINVASRGGLMLQPGLPGYCVGKASEIRLSELAGREVDGTGVAVFSIQPGDAHTGMSDATVNDPDAQKHLPGMVEVVKHWMENADSQAAFDRCAEMCVDLASGKYHALSGKYLEPSYDLDRMLAELQPWDERNPVMLGGAQSVVLPGKDS